MNNLERICSRLLSLHRLLRGLQRLMILRLWLRFFVRMMRDGLLDLFFVRMVGSITDVFACKQLLRAIVMVSICVTPWR